MARSVREMAKWFIMPDGEALDDLPEGFDGDAMLIRPLSRLEVIEMGRQVGSVSELSLDNLPVEALTFAAKAAVTDWTLKARDGSKLPLSEIVYLDEGFEFAIDRALTLMTLPNADGSGNNS